MLHRDPKGSSKGVYGFQSVLAGSEDFAGMRRDLCMPERRL